MQREEKYDNTAQLEPVLHEEKAPPVLADNGGLPSSDPYLAGEPSISAGPFDFRQHQEACGYRRKGLWTWCGERFGDLEVRLRPGYEEPVVVRREAVEQHIRHTLQLSPEQPLPGEKLQVANKAAVTMAVTGMRGHVVCSDKMVEIARRYGWQLNERSHVVTLTGAEEAEQVRELLHPMLEVSTPLLNVLVRLSRSLEQVPDKEIVSLGEDFVFGRHVTAGWLD